MKFRPLNDWLLVKLDPDKNETPGGLITIHGERHRTGTVLEAGPGAYRKQYTHMGGPGDTSKFREVFKPTEVKPGDVVTFWRENLEHKSGQETNEHIVHLLGDDMGIVRENDVLFYEPREI
jgi:co-chaperonin GroES (HSP10)